MYFRMFEKLLCGEHKQFYNSMDALLESLDTKQPLVF